MPLRAAAALAAAAAAGAARVDPVPVHDAAPYTRTVARHAHGVLQLVTPPDTQPLPVLHVHGNASERGEATGELLADTIASFATKVFNDYVVAIIENLQLGGLPEWLQDRIKRSLGKVAPGVLQEALGWVARTQAPWNHAAHDGTTHIYDEIAGIARGVCRGIGPARCEHEFGGEGGVRERVGNLNMLPELLRMDCSMLGASRSATRHGKLVQLRSLDFGSVPFANYGLVSVHHTDDTPEGAFATVTFPAFVGAVTGLNGAGLIQSQKVMYDAVAAGYNQTCVTPGGSNPHLNPYGCIPATFQGESSPYVIRRIVETARSKAEAEDIIDKANRTWHFYLGLGDSVTEDFDVVGYAEQQTKTWTWDTLHGLTTDPAIKDVAFVDHETQPNSDRTLHDLLAALAPSGLTGRTVASVVPHATGSGDVHHMVVDHGEGKFYVAMGTTVPNGTSYVRKACDAPVVAFDLSELWAMPPAEH